MAEEYSTEMEEDDPPTKPKESPSSDDEIDWSSIEDKDESKSDWKDYPSCSDQSDVPEPSSDEENESNSTKDESSADEKDESISDEENESSSTNKDESSSDDENNDCGSTDTDSTPEEEYSVPVSWSPLLPTSAEGECQLGYFLNEHKVKVEPKRIHVLVLHNDFARHQSTRSRAEIAEKISKMEKTFKYNRKCIFRVHRVDGSVVENGDWSPSLRNSMMNEFKTSVSPDIFILAILSHGKIDSASETNSKEFDMLNAREIVEDLNVAFKRSLKIVIFDNCRDNELHPAQHQMKSLSDQMDNFVLLSANYDENWKYKKSTALIQKLCEVLDNLAGDEPLVSVLTRVQQKVHEESLKDPERENAQTMEIVYTAHKKFIVSRCENAQGEITDRRDRFFSWKSDTGYDVRRRQAVVFCETKSEKVNKLLQVLKAGLDFEVLCLPNTTKSHSDFATAVSSGLCKYGCLLVCCFGIMEEKNRALHVRVGNDLMPIDKVVKNCVGPLDETWENLPKIAFFLQQDMTAALKMKKQQANYGTAASHNGWFVQVLPDNDGAENLIQMLSSPALTEGKTSLQELALELLGRHPVHQGDLIPKISTTLNYLLDFPKWPKDFVSPKLSVVNLKKQKVPERNVELGELKDEFLQSYLQGNDRKYCVYLLSGEIGAGKTTILKELMSHFRKVDDCVVVDTQLSEDKLDDHFKSIQLRDFIDHNPARKIGITDEALKSKSVIFVMQGFDTMSDDDQEIALDLMYIIAKNRLPLWIETGPKEEGVIIDKLKRFEIVKVKIHPLNVAQQLELVKLKTKWTEKEVEKFLAFHGKTAVKTLLENPLHLSLLLKSEHYFQTKSAEVCLYTFYDYVVKEHLSRCIEFPPDSAQHDEHLQKCIEDLLCFSMCGYVRKPVRLQDKENVTELEKSGIVIIPGGNAEPRFEHQILKEFLIAKSILTGQCTSSIICKLMANPRVAEFLEKRCDENLCDLLLKEEDFDYQLECIVKFGYVNIFNLLKPKITFEENSDKKLKFVSPDDWFLRKACARGEKIGITLLEMGAFKISPYGSLHLEEIVRYGCLKLLDKVVSICPKILEDDDSPVVVAAEFNRLKMLKVLLRRYKVDVNKKDYKFNDTALQRASAEGHIKCIKELLKHKAEVDAVNSLGETALHLAAKNGQAEAVSCLLENGVNPKLKDAATNGRNALYLAFLSEDLETVQAFHSKKPEFFQKQMKHHFEEFLLMTIEKRNAAICSFVIENGATSKDILKSGRFVMDSVLPRGKENSEEDFKFACKIFAKTSKFVQAGDSSGWTMLHKAAKEGNFQAVDCLLQSGAQIQGQTKEGYTPLHVVCLFTQDVKLLKFLIQKGACLVTVDGKMNNCLHLACTGANWNLLPVLLEEFKTYDLIDVPDLNGKTALHIAAMRNCPIEGFVEFFDKEADFDVKDNDNLVPLDYSRQFRGDICSIKWHSKEKKKTTEKRKAPASSPSRSTRPRLV